MSETTNFDELYRPKTFQDIVGNADIVAQLQLKCKNKTIPHLLLYGPPGCGKTTIALVIIRALYGENWKQHRYLEINASDDNGIDVVRTNIKDFARYSSGTNEVGFRVIILDEADQMTDKAQSALRRLMEIYKRRCRIILICNQKWKIIDPIQSRCTPLEFHPITTEEMLPRLKYICGKEHIEITNEALVFAAESTHGDIRSAINTYLEPIRSLHTPITLQTIQKLKIDGGELLPIVKDGLNSKLVSARQKYYSLLKRGYTLRSLLEPCIDQILPLPYPELMKSEILQALCSMEMGILQGGNEAILIMHFIATCALIGERYR